MQKKWIFLILLILAMSLSACTKNSDGEVTNKNTQYLSKENMLSTQGLTKVEGEGVIYYTDIVGEAPNIIAVNDSNIIISYNKVKDIEGFKNLNEEAIIKDFESKGRVVENVKIEENKLRGVNVKFVTFSVNSKNYRQLVAFTKKNQIVVNQLSLGEDDPLNKTFENIINTIY